MSIIQSDSVNQPTSFSVGSIKHQVRDISIQSGQTSGTLTATRLGKLFHVLLPSGITLTAAPTYSGQIATLAFTVPTETTASKAIQDITYTATAQQGAGGNAITITYTAGGTAGAEVVTVVGKAISIQIASGVSTATQVKAAYDASAAATALATSAITGTAGTAQTAQGPTALAGGVTGGAYGTALLMGRG